MPLLSIFFAPINAIQFTLKGGVSNVIDIALFKNKDNFETFIEHVGGSKESARAVEAFTNENTALIASTGGAIITGIAVVASQGTLTPAAGAINALAVAGLTAGAMLSGKLAHVGANVIRSFAKDYASHYIENIKLHVNNTVCRGITGDKLVRRRNFPSGSPDYMNFTNPQSMYLVIFNKETIKDPYNPKTVICEPYTIIFAGAIKPEHLGSAFDIRTEIVTYYDTDKYNNPKTDAANNPIVINRAVGVRLDITDKNGGLICTKNNLSPASIIAAHTQWATGLNNILKNNIINNTIKLENDKQLALQIVDQLNKIIATLPQTGNYQDSITKINTLINQANTKQQFNDVTKAVDDLLKNFESYEKIKL